ncbi:MAG: hypothetical protein ACP5RI_02255 [Candidatus Micrarchaeia archaeon]
MSTISKNCGISYVHTINFINKCAKLGLIENTKHGRIKEIKLTDKGVQLTELVSKINSILEDKSINKPQQAEVIK